MNVIGIILTIIILIALLWILSGLAYWIVLIVGICLIVYFVLEQTGATGPGSPY